jgi:phage shock protein PspC (stress-responsive transcriptional regulator)
MENQQHPPSDPKEADTTSEPPPDSPSPLLAKRLTKRRDAGWFTGVSAGGGAYLGLDPNWVRLGFVILTFVGGIGAAVYLLAAFFLPDATPEEVAAQPIAERPYNERWTTKEWYLGSGKWFSIIAFFVLACSVGSAWDVGGLGFVLALLLAGVGIYLLSDAERAGEVRDRMFGGAGSASVSAAPHDGTTSYAVPPTYRPEPNPEQQRLREAHEAARRQARRDRRALKSITLGSVLLAIGGMATLDFADVRDFTFSGGLAVALLVLGVGIVAGAWRGRSYLLILLAFLLTPFVVASNTVDGVVNHGAGEVRWTPVNASQLRSEYRFGVGRAELDLSQVRLAADESREVQVNMNTGLLVVKLPAGVGYDLSADAKCGSLALFGVDDDEISSNNSERRTAPGQGTIVVNASIDKGRIVIDQSSAATTEVNQ